MIYQFNKLINIDELIFFISICPRKYARSCLNNNNKIIKIQVPAFKNFQIYTMAKLLHMSQIISAKLGHTGITEIESSMSMTQFSLTRDNSLKGKLPSLPSLLAQAAQALPLFMLIIPPDLHP